MGKPQRRKKIHTRDKKVNRVIKTKGYKRDVDQRHADLEPANAALLLNQPIDEDLPGRGQFYCIACARYFITERALFEHNKTKQHKRQVKATRETPYTQAEADRCAGMTKAERVPVNNI